MGTLCATGGSNRGSSWIEVTGEAEAGESHSLPSLRELATPGGDLHATNRAHLFRIYINMKEESSELSIDVVLRRFMIFE
jgi:hypothetical protein